MDLREQKKQAKAFIERWTGRGNERQDSQSFWLDLLGSVYGIENPSSYITFEDKVMLDHTSFIDGYIEKTKVLIEQKGATKDLNKAIKQSDGSFLTPFQQAKRYSANLPYSQRPRWIVTCNFREFYIYDMEQPNSEATVIKLADLATESYRLEFLIDKTNEHLEREMAISMQAGEIVGEIYDGLLKQYITPDSPETLHAINQLIVRLVFCLYAEDSGLFGHKLAFHDYLAQFSAPHFRKGLIELFEVLDTPLAERDPYLAPDLAAFPYVNGGMFAEKQIEIPNVTEELRQLILEHASSNFDWSDISPTIFGAVFESTLNPETRRSGGMHYTSIENIHKVIDPLFLDELKEELNTIRQFKQATTVEQKAKQFQHKLASLTFFDPACGSGNFLTETYIALRRLENEAIKLYMGDKVYLDTGQDLVKVKLNQFYGIEINDFAVSVAKTALWIAESQMLEATKEIVFANIDFLPLKSYTHIVHGNALTTDWETVVDKTKLRYIIGNPPFVGARYMEEEQKKLVQEIFSNLSKSDVQMMDFVTCWFKKAGELIQGTNIRVALVSTNSIVQGSQVPILWNVLLNDYQLQLDFAYQSFVWNSEAKDKAAVHCVIIGFSDSSWQNESKYLFVGDSKEKVKIISPYLTSSAISLIENRTMPISDVPQMKFGNQPRDGGYLILTDEEKNELVSKSPEIEKWIRPYIGAAEFINNIKRWCIWLKNASPSDIKMNKVLYERVSAVREFRLSSKAKTTNGYAKVPHLFAQLTQPDDTPYIIIPRVSSERRRYVPMGFMTPNDISSDAVQIIPNASLYHFGVLTSNVHMAWMRTVAGRLKSDYRYSAKIVYNNFPWPDLDEASQAKIAQTAQAILDARALYPDSSLADLYDELTMPIELRKAHQANDKAVMTAYGMTKQTDGKTTWLTESETVGRLFELYEERVGR